MHSQHITTELVTFFLKFPTFLQLPLSCSSAIIPAVAHVLLSDAALAVCNPVELILTHPLPFDKLYSITFQNRTCRHPKNKVEPHANSPKPFVASPKSPMQANSLSFFLLCIFTGIFTYNLPSFLSAIPQPVVVVKNAYNDIFTLSSSDFCRFWFQTASHSPLVILTFRNHHQQPHNFSLLLLHQHECRPVSVNLFPVFNFTWQKSSKTHNLCLQPNHRKKERIPTTRKNSHAIPISLFLYL